MEEEHTRERSLAAGTIEPGDRTGVQYDLHTLMSWGKTEVKQSMHTETLV
jgi:hypothetical protein